MPVLLRAIPHFNAYSSRSTVSGGSPWTTRTESQWGMSLLGLHHSQYLDTQLFEAVADRRSLNDPYTKADWKAWKRYEWELHHEVTYTSPACRSRHEIQDRWDAVRLKTEDRMMEEWVLRSASPMITDVAALRSSWIVNTLCLAYWSLPKSIQYCTSNRNTSS